MSIKASPYAEYTHEQILYYSDDIEGNGEPLLDTDGDTLQDHIYEFCEVKVILGTRTTWKRVKMNGGEEKYEVWLGTKVTLPKTGPFTAQWTISHAVVSSEPKRGKCLPGYSSCT